MMVTPPNRAYFISMRLSALATHHIRVHDNSTRNDSHLNRESCVFLILFLVLLPLFFHRMPTAESIGPVGRQIRM